MRVLSVDELDSMNLKYYNPEIHKASFILPEFARKVRLLEMLTYDAPIASTLLNACLFFFLTGALWSMTLKTSRILRLAPSPQRSSVVRHPTPSLKIRPADDGDPCNCFQCLCKTDSEQWTLFWVRHEKKVSVFSFQSYSVYLLFSKHLSL